MGPVGGIPEMIQISSSCSRRSTLKLALKRPAVIRDSRALRNEVIMRSYSINLNPNPVSPLDQIYQ